MKNVILAAMLLLLTAQVGEAQVYEYKAYSWANFGSPFTFFPTTKGELASAIDGGYVPLGGEPTRGTLNDLFQIGQTAWSDEYDVGGGLHVKFSSEAVHHEAEPLSTDPPGIGAKAFASNNQYIGPQTVIGESFVYLKHTVDDIPPGEYQLVAQAYATKFGPGNFRFQGEQIATLEHLFIVPELSTPRTNSPFDLGPLTLSPFQPVKSTANP